MGPALALAFVLALQPPSPDTGTDVRTLQDFQTIDMSTALPEFQAANAALIGGVTPQKMTVKAALDAARALVKPTQNRTTLAALRARPELQSPGALRAFATAAIASHQPLLALAALVVAEERAPGNTAVRFDMASLLAWHGSVNEADALLDDIAGRTDLPAHPFGITPKDGFDYLRAYVRMRQGKTDEAVALLTPIVNGNYAFGEAALALALIEASQGKDARQHFLMGVFRRPIPASQAAPPPGPAQTTASGTPVRSSRAPRDVFRLDASSLVDLSKGNPGVLPAIKQPASLQEEVAYVTWLSAKSPELMAEGAALGQARDQAGQALSNTSRPKPVRQRLLALESMVDPATARLAEVQELRRALDHAIVEKTDTLERVGKEFATRQGELLQQYAQNPRGACPELLSSTQRATTTLRAKVQDVDDLTRKLNRSWHQYATALGSLSADPGFHAYLAAQIALQDHADYYTLVANMGQGATFAQTGIWRALGCLEQGGAKRDDLGKLDNGQLPFCSEEDSKNTLGFGVHSDVGVHAAEPAEFSLGVEASCDTLSVEAGLDLFRSFGLSAELEFKINGTATVYIGPKWSVGDELGPISRDFSHKEGAYLTVDKDAIRDVGVRTVTKDSTKVGILGAEVSSSREIDKTEVSFFPAPDVPARPSFGLSDFTAPK